MKDIEYMVKSYNRREPFFKKVVYEILKNNLDGSKENIEHVIKKFNIKGRYLSERVESFLKEVSNNKELQDAIINKYESHSVKLDAEFEEKATRKNTEKDIIIDKIDKLPLLSIDVLKTDYNHLEELSNSKKFNEVINHMISSNILPTSEEGKKIIEVSNLDKNGVIYYFSLLDRLTARLNYNENRNKMKKLMIELNDTEYDLIAELESECLTLDDQEGMQMLNQHCVRKNKIEAIYQLQKLDKEQRKKEELQSYFNSLNVLERYLIEDLNQESLTLDDQEGMQLLNERAVNKEKVIEYFKLRNEIDYNLLDMLDPITKDELTTHEREEDNEKKDTEELKASETEDLDNPITQKDEEALTTDEIEGDKEKKPQVEEEKKELTDAERRKRLEERFKNYTMNGAYLDSIDYEYQRMLREKAMKEAYEKENRKAKFFNRIKKHIPSIFKIEEKDNLLPENEFDVPRR